MPLFVTKEIQNLGRISVMLHSGVSERGGIFIKRSSCILHLRIGWNWEPVSGTPGMPLLLLIRRWRLTSIKGSWITGKVLVRCQWLLETRSWNGSGHWIIMWGLMLSFFVIAWIWPWIIITRSRIICYLTWRKPLLSGCLPLRRIWENWPIRVSSYRRGSLS